MSRLFRFYGQAGGAGSQTLRVTYPANAWLGQADSPVSEGTFPGTLVGSWHEVSSTHYLYVTQNDGTGRFVGVDPGDFEARLTGMTGVEIQLPAGTLTPAQVGTQIETQWNAAGTSVVATYNGLVANTLGVGQVAQVDFVGGINAAAIVAAGPGTSFAARNTDATALGAQELAASVAAANIDWQSWCECDLTYAPAASYRIVGIGYIGTNLRIGIASGGALGDPEGASVIYDSGVLAGSAGNWLKHYFTPAESAAITTVAASSRMWLGCDGTDTLSDIWGGSGQDEGWQSTGGGAGVNLYRTGTSNGVGTPFAATVGALNGGNFNFGLSMYFIIQPTPFFGSFGWQSKIIYDRVRQGNPPSTVGMNSVSPTFPCSLPVVENLAVESIEVYVPANSVVAQNGLRIESWVSAGAMSLSSATGETLHHDFGEFANGGETGWIEIVGSPVDISTVGEIRFSIKSASVGNSMVLGFLSGGFGNNVGKVGHSLAATVEDGELEYLASAGETWWDFRAGNATGTPLAPNSVPTTPGNQPGVDGTIGTPGFSMTANP